MPKTDYRLYLIASVLLCQTLPLFSQKQAVIIRLTGDRTTSSSEGLASGAAFMPGISAEYTVRNWGILAEYGAFSSPGQLNLETYTKNIQDFTTRNINSTQWKTNFLLAGISYRKSLGYGLQADMQLTGGMLYRKPPSYSINDKIDGTRIADVYDETKTSTATDNALFAWKPEIRLEWFPVRGPIGLNIHASYLGVLGASEVSTYYRDLSNLRVDGVSQQEIRAQVLKLPIIESRSHGPVSTFSFGAGISLKIGTASKSGGPRPQNNVGNRGINHLHREKIIHRDIAARNIVHRDLAARNLIAGRLEWNVGKNAAGILTNESASGAGQDTEDILNTTISARANTGAENTGSYHRVFSDGKGTVPDTSLVSLKTNPLYTGDHASGTNVLHDNNARTGNNPLYEAGGMTGNNPMAGAEIVLVDQETGEVLASTKTEKEGDFFFANVPDGQYAVHIRGMVTIQQSYNLHASGDADITGIVKTGAVQPVLNLTTEKTNDVVDQQQARQRSAALVSDEHAVANTSSRQALKGHFETGDKPTSSQRAMPGNPIGGIIVKGGKNPGGSFMTTTTDNNGIFTWDGLKAGDYTLTLIQTINLDDEAEAALQTIKN